MVDNEVIFGTNMLVTSGGPIISVESIFGSKTLVRIECFKSMLFTVEEFHRRRKPYGEIHCRKKPARLHRHLVYKDTIYR
ncbi:hypothetical protein EVAR_37366_1 [Eumeta japonica]|uniref:Uncharacterized protein n=1 Tax=Eumeta variegata TaxID=151549 RepID=A0A4C1ZUR3_EUMVA|nr:hypothetical protein EVAR_37366_1 [Eumeta japonica]